MQRNHSDQVSYDVSSIQSEFLLQRPQSKTIKFHTQRNNSKQPMKLCLDTQRLDPHPSYCLPSATSTPMPGLPASSDCGLAAAWVISLRSVCPPGYKLRSRRIDLTSAWGRGLAVGRAGNIRRYKFVRRRSAVWPRRINTAGTKHCYHTPILPIISTVVSTEALTLKSDASPISLCPISQSNYR